MALYWDETLICFLSDAPCITVSILAGELTLFPALYMFHIPLTLILPNALPLPSGKFHTWILWKVINRIFTMTQKISYFPLLAICFFWTLHLLLASQTTPVIRLQIVRYELYLSPSSRHQLVLLYKLRFVRETELIELINLWNRMY